MVRAHFYHNHSHGSGINLICDGGAPQVNPFRALPFNTVAMAIKFQHEFWRGHSDYSGPLPKLLYLWVSGVRVERKDFRHVLPHFSCVIVQNKTDYECCTGL